MSARQHRILITGATGQIGSELTIVLREKYGGSNVVAAGHMRPPSQALAEGGPFEYVDVSREKDLMEIVEKYDITMIYHLGAILSAAGERDHQMAWQVNMDGLVNVLEIARERKLARVFWPSSIAVFGPDAPRIKTPQNTVLVPTSMYGVTKVSGELLCNYYFNRFGVDVRSLRYPGIISSETPPGGGTTDYAVEMFYEALQRKSYTCFLRQDTVMPMMYMPDCLKATIDLMEADAKSVKQRTSYNLAALSFSAEELANEIRKHVPGFECDYVPDYRQAIADSWPMSIDDSQARKDWGWAPSYDSLSSVTKDMIEKLSKKLAVAS